MMVLVAKGDKKRDRGGSIYLFITSGESPDR